MIASLNNTLKKNKQVTFLEVLLLVKIISY
jgi:hypothetical protein